MTVDIYETVMGNMKPTPNKSHYTFNLRDMSKIFQGICSADRTTADSVVSITRLWVHECSRVFGDRLISNEDREKLREWSTEGFQKSLELSPESVYEHERILFGDFMRGLDLEQRPYEEITDLNLMKQKIDEYLEDHNSGTKHPMKLIMFLDACEHVCRISRVLRQPSGNALLLGVGGSGRQSLAKMSNFISNYTLYQIEVIKGYSMAMWRDNLKECLMQAGVDGKPTTFLFVDTQIINEQMLEDINNVLNSGDVPGLYKNEDMEDIFNVGKQLCMKKNL